MRRFVLTCCISAAMTGMTFGGDPPASSVFSEAETRSQQPESRPSPPTGPREPVKPPAPKSRPDSGEPVSPIDPLVRAPEGGTQPAETFNPNMFGDLFGGQLQPMVVLRQRVFRSTLTDAAGAPVVFVGPLGTQILIPNAGTSIVLRDNGLLSAPFQTNFVTAATIGAGTASVGVLENALVTQQLQALNPGANIAYLPDQSNAVRQGGVARNNPRPTFLVDQGYLIATRIPAELVLPFGGGVAGRTKISDGNYPLPADRLILDFDQFGGAAVTPRGYNVSRLSIGGEATAFGGAASAELRLPIASTLDPVERVGGFTSRELVIGDLNLTLKALFANADGVVAAGGVGIAFPTAPDALLQDAAGVNLLRVRNQSFVVTPFVAAALAPDAPWFAQAWVQCSFDANGNAVMADPFGFGNLQGVGRIHDPALLQTDVQIGYWLYHDFSGGVAPFAELHYNQSLGTRSNFVSNGVVLYGGNALSEVNLALGVAAQIGPSLFVNLGFAFPLRTAPDRSFDYQLGLRASWYFGSFGRGY